jgi:hypothetical protein
VASEVELSLQDLRVVARYAAESAQDALSIFEETHPGDRRPRVAVEATWTFAEGAKRTKLQRTSALAAHKPAQEAMTEAAGTRHAPPAMPRPRPICTLSQDRPRSNTSWAPRHTQHARRSWPPAGIEVLEHSELSRLAQRATPAPVTVLRRYPAAPTSDNRVAELLSALDTSLRSL